jgi:hypothetical protein
VAQLWTKVDAVTELKYIYKGCQLRSRISYEFLFAFYLQVMKSLMNMQLFFRADTKDLETNGKSHFL